MPDEVKDSFGFIADERGETYRCAYVVAFERVVYVLDVFQKKSTSGKATPMRDRSRVKHRYQLTKAHYELNKHRYLPDV